MEPLPLPPPRHWTLPSSYGADLYNEPLSDGAEKGGGEGEEVRGLEFQLLSKVWSFLESWSASKIPQTELCQTASKHGCD